MNFPQAVCKTGLSNILFDYTLSRLTLTFDLLNSKSNQFVCVPTAAIVNLLKFPPADGPKTECIRRIIADASITSSSAIAERPRWRVGQLWPKVEDDILQTI